MDVGKEREHDCRDAGGRAPTVGALGDAGAVAEERKLFRQSGRRKHQFSLALKPAYSGLRRDVYNDKHWSVGTINEAHQAINFVFFVVKNF